eukprot:TRINITY_DN1642_c0_g1_i3.p1 TRINITY_DN1642_c0_g1~~TRINITY_DN1642_c0_g1_i3.p1  ORF type:complete len:202 (+),score=29.00 TRINITY_DN1642_c0_g1_i3:364-969(+)
MRKKQISLQISGKSPRESCFSVPDIITKFRGLVYSIAIRNDPSNYDKLLELHDQADLHEERVRILRSLGAAPTEELLKRTLDFSMSGTVRAQDGIAVIDAVAVNRNKGAELCWKFFTENHEKAFFRYKGISFILLLTVVTSHTTNREQLQSIKEWFQDRTQPGTARTLAQSYEAIERNIAWLERDSRRLEQWFIDRKLTEN